MASSERGLDPPNGLERTRLIPKRMKRSSYPAIRGRRSGVQGSVRIPVHYGSMRIENLISAAQADRDNHLLSSETPTLTVNGSSSSEADTTWCGNTNNQEHSAALSRYRYYNRLAPGQNSLLLMPEHVVPACFFQLLPKSKGQQSSLVTIFSVWNTMMGTSLLSMPWAIQQAGFASGILLMIFFAGLSFYTAYIVLQSTIQLNAEHNPPKDSPIDFTYVCRHYLGRTGSFLALKFSFIALLGAMIVYYVLMSNFLYHTVDFLHTSFEEPNIKRQILPPIQLANENISDVICGHMPSYSVDPPNISITPAPSRMEYLFTEDPSALNRSQSTLYGKLWSQTRTVPAWLLIAIFPLISIRSPTFFTKFNALGTLSVAYLLFLVIYKSAHWGLHLHLWAPSTDVHNYIPEFRPTFASLTGIASLAFFIHNAIEPIMRSQRNPENNARDLLIAYVCVAGTYLCVAIAFYITFPFVKSCIEDNFLNNFLSTDLLAFFARIALFFQTITVFPLLAYILRVQIMYAVFGHVYPSAYHVGLFHFVVLIPCIAFSMFVPQIGNIIRFSGALCGMVYVFTLPCLVHLLSLRSNDRLTWTALIGHLILIGLGIANFIGQFVVIFVN